MNALIGGADECTVKSAMRMKSMIVFKKNLIARELPPDQAEYCIQRMQPYSGMDAVQVETPLNFLISHNLFQSFGL